MASGKSDVLRRTIVGRRRALPDGGRARRRPRHRPGARPVPGAHRPDARPARPGAAALRPRRRDRGRAGRLGRRPQRPAPGAPAHRTPPRTSPAPSSWTRSRSRATTRSPGWRPRSTRCSRSLAASRDRQRQLVADAGHELRTPLTSLRTNLDLLAQADGSSPAVARGPGGPARRRPGPDRGADHADRRPRRAGPRGPGAVRAARPSTSDESSSRPSRGYDAAHPA